MLTCTLFLSRIIFFYGLHVDILILLHVEIHKSHFDIIMLHVDIHVNKSHVDIIMLHVACIMSLVRKFTRIKNDF